MNFFRKLFGGKSQRDFYNEEEEELDPEKPPYDPVKMKQLEDLITPLLKQCTRIRVQEASRMPDDSNLISQFGGLPYFEAGEQWPKSEAGNNLSFVFQVFNQDGIHLPKNIKLVQFYYGLEDLPGSTDDDGWKVKIYEKLNQDAVLKIERPDDVERPKFCNITLETQNSLPDWESIDDYIEGYTDLAEAIDEEDPWEVHNEIVLKLTGNDNYQSQLGGYPRWVQGERNTGR
ncbi:MAG: DUF1963 domain-containing protein [Flavobacterium sp.]